MSAQTRRDVCKRQEFDRQFLSGVEVEGEKQRRAIASLWDTKAPRPTAMLAQKPVLLQMSVCVNIANLFKQSFHIKQKYDNKMGLHRRLTDTVGKAAALASSCGAFGFLAVARD